VVVVAAIIARYGIDGLFMSTMMAGIILLVLGATGLGAAVKYIPQPVVVGFTNGIAIVIASTQIRDLFGLQMTNVPGDFLPKMHALIAAHTHGRRRPRHSVREHSRSSSSGGSSVSGCPGTSWCSSG
jgi:MFS superfamily sulfate permease-like transporter